VFWHPHFPLGKEGFCFMVTTAEQQTSERLRSFNPSASVLMMRYDLQTQGRVLDETKNQVCDEEISYLAEASDQVARTTFTLKREGESLMYFRHGQWRPYIGMLLTGRGAAYSDAEADPRRQFLAVKSDGDLLKGYQMQKLRPGERMRWHSSYMYEQEALYGKEFMQS
jgi:hypothetical protein